MPTYDVGSSEWWIERLVRRLIARRNDLVLLDDYYAGDHRLTFASSKYREAFGHLFRAFADNFCLLVVDAERERLNVEGFRIGPDRKADDDAWAIWQANDLDARSAIAHTEALVKGVCYVAVWAGDDREPLITIEDPLQVIVEQDFGGRGARRAALKLWHDDELYLRMTLYLPDRIEKYRSKAPLRAGQSFSVDRWTKAEAWDRREVEGEAWPLPNGLGVVPIVPLVNNPRLSGEGRSEIAAVIPIQDAINKTIADMLVASEFGAFRQRWATGIDIPVDENGNPVEPFKTAVDRLWVANPVDGAAEGPRFGEFAQTDLTSYVATVGMLVQHLASITKTPSLYLTGENKSAQTGEARKSTEMGLVAKSKLAMRYFGEGWEEVIRLAFQVKNDARATVMDAETIWRDPETKAEAELTDAMVKQKTLGVPDEEIWAQLGYSPQQIARFRVLAAAQRLAAPPLAPPAVVAPPRPNGGA